MTISLVGSLEGALLGWLMGFLSVFLILLILIQRGKGGGLTGALGGPGGQSAFGSKAGDTFTMITIVVASIWGITCAVTMLRLGTHAPTTITETNVSAGPGDEETMRTEPIVPARESNGGFGGLSAGDDSELTTGTPSLEVTPRDAASPPTDSDSVAPATTETKSPAPADSPNAGGDEPDAKASDTKASDASTEGTDSGSPDADSPQADASGDAESTSKDE